MRRRLLDLGFTPGAKVTAVLSNVRNEAHAYRIRDTLIALRREQAEQVIIRPTLSRPLQDQEGGQATP